MFGIGVCKDEQDEFTSAKSTKKCAIAQLQFPIVVKGLAILPAQKCGKQLKIIEKLKKYQMHDL